jgi:lipoate---protein ligase
VLGSTQSIERIDVERATGRGLDVVRRRSGGGAVAVGPGDQIWVEVTVPRGDPLWDDDVGRAAWWLGDAWREALQSIGVCDLAAHRGGLIRNEWSDDICFAGLGPGEVTAGGRKIVGLAQRRTRDGSRFQCAVPVSWRPEAWLDVLGFDAEAQGRALESVAVATLPAAVAQSATDRFVESVRQC